MTNTEPPQQTATLTIDQALQQAVAYHQAGQLQDAERLYRAILQAQPNHLDANHNLGVLAVQVKQPAVGLPHLKAALEANPNHGQYWLSYIDALIQTGQTDAARQVLEQGRQLGLNSEAIKASAGRLDQLENATLEQPAELECAIAHREAGRYKEAALVLQSWLISNSQDASAHALLAQVLSLDKQDEPAWLALKMALSINPALPIVQRSHARLLLKQQKLDEALRAAQAAYQSDATDPENQLVLAAALGANNRNEQALLLVTNALQSRPNYAEAFANRALLKLRSGDPVGALVDAEKALSIKPHLGQLWGMVSSLRHQSQNLPGAVDALEKALDYEPDNVGYLVNLGELKRQAGEVDTAIVLLEKAVAIAPDNAGAWINLGTALQMSKRIPEAKAAYAKALEIVPEQAEVANNLGALAKEEENWEEALRYFNQALEIKPDIADAHSNLGVILKKLGRLDEAETSYRRALQIKPDFAEAHSNLGTTLKAQDRLSEAEVSYRRALQIKPDFASAHQSLATVLAYLSDFAQVVMESDAALDLIPDDVIIWEQRLYTYSYHPDLTAQEIYKEFVRWGDRFPDPAVDFGTHDRTPGRRLRIGYVSPDFRRHTSRFFFWPLFANHDHAVVELYAYSNVRLEDDVTQKFKGLFDHWRNIRGVADNDVAQMIRQDGIDILMDCCNHMRDDRLGVFTLKPAPIQATWLGAAWTTGLKMIDYALIDPYMAPEGTLTRETIVRLPHCFVAYRPPGETAEVAPPPCLKNGYVTFGYTGRTERLNHHTFRVWGEILRQNPTARLILDFRSFADPPTQAHYRQFMIRHGMDSNQVIMRKSTNIFAGLNDIDILLDSFPHSGGTMLFDALWMGVPILTLASRPPVGRIGTSLMMNLDLPEWVAESEQEYIGKAYTFAANPHDLVELRAGIRQRMQNSPVMDEVGFARGVEAAYREMYEKWAKGCAQE